MAPRARPKGHPLVGWIVVALLVTTPHRSNNAFSPPNALSLPPPRHHVHIASSALSSSPGSNNNCECYNSISSSRSNMAVISGSPSIEARDINIKEALSKSTVYRIDDGSPISVSNFFASSNEDDGGDGVSLIVLTRSFG